MWQDCEGLDEVIPLNAVFGLVFSVSHSYERESWPPTVCESARSPRGSLPL